MVEFCTNFNSKHLKDSPNPGEVIDNLRHYLIYSLGFQEGEDSGFKKGYKGKTDEILETRKKTRNWN